MGKQYSREIVHTSPHLTIAEIEPSAVLSSGSSRSSGTSPFVTVFSLVKHTRV